MTITIHFDRSASTARYAMPPDRGDYFAECADPYFALARTMTDAGEPDGAALFVDERGMPCFTVRSLHSMARRYRPNDADKAMHEANRTEREARKKTKGQPTQ